MRCREEKEKGGGGQRQAKLLEGEITLTMKRTDTIPLLKRLTCDPKTTLIAQEPKTIGLPKCIQNIRDASGRIMQNVKEEEGALGGAELF